MLLHGSFPPFALEPWGQRLFFLPNANCTQTLALRFIGKSNGRHCHIQNIDHKKNHVASMLASVLKAFCPKGFSHRFVPKKTSWVFLEDWFQYLEYPTCVQGSASLKQRVQRPLVKNGWNMSKSSGFKHRARILSCRFVMQGIVEEASHPRKYEKTSAEKFQRNHFHVILNIFIIHSLHCILFNISCLCVGGDQLDPPWPPPITPRCTKYCAFWWSRMVLLPIYPCPTFFVFPPPKPICPESMDDH